MHHRRPPLKDAASVDTAGLSPEAWEVREKTGGTKPGYTGTEDLRWTDRVTIIPATREESDSKGTQGGAADHAEEETEEDDSEDAAAGAARR